MYSWFYCHSAVLNFHRDELKKGRETFICRYMFIWPVCPTSVEMDLTFVSVVRFNRSLLPCTRPAPPVRSSARGELMDKGRGVGWHECVTKRRNGPLHLDRDVDFDSLCRTEVWFISNLIQASSASAPRQLPKQLDRRHAAEKAKRRQKVSRAHSTMTRSYSSTVFSEQHSLNVVRYSSAQTFSFPRFRRVEKFLMFRVGQRWRDGRGRVDTAKKVYVVFSSVVPCTVTLTCSSGQHIAVRTGCSFHRRLCLDGYTRPVAVIAVLCVCQLVRLMKRSIRTDPFFSAPWNIHSVDIQLVPPQEGKLESKERSFVLFCFCGVFLVISHANMFWAPLFSNNTRREVTKQCLQKEVNKFVDLFLFFFFSSQKETAAYHIELHDKIWREPLCAHCINGTEPAFSVFSNPVLIYVVLYRTNSGIKYSIYDCIIV